MNGNAAQHDLAVLLGQELIQICIGKYQVQLHFSPQAAIAIEQEFDLTLPNGTKAVPDKLPILASNLVSILGEKIEAIGMESDDTPQIRFSSGHIVRVLKSKDGLEACRVTGDDLDLIV